MESGFWLFDAWGDWLLPSHRISISSRPAWSDPCSSCFTAYSAWSWLPTCCFASSYSWRTLLSRPWCRVATESAPPASSSPITPRVLHISFGCNSAASNGRKSRSAALSNLLCSWPCRDSANGACIHCGCCRDRINQRREQLDTYSKSYWKFFGFYL